MISSVVFWPESGTVAAMGEMLASVAPMRLSCVPQWRQ
jgi:hypothetical protein